MLLVLVLASFLDLVFAIDGSDSLLPEQFDHLKQLIKHMIDEYTISEDATRVGVMEYSDAVSIEINLNDFHQAWKLKAAVDDIKASSNKGAVTDEVLQKAAEEMFIPENG
jgi:collagen type VI alpha